LVVLFVETFSRYDCRKLTVSILMKNTDLNSRVTDEW
jgi:hypothetical protein